VFVRLNHSAWMELLVFKTAYAAGI